MYHYQAPGSDPRNYRLHLRLEADGRGVLIVNAATLLHLNHTAAEYAFYLVQNLPEDQVVKNVVSRYHVSSEDARQHYRDFAARIDTLVSTPDLDPVTFLDFERQEPFSGKISAPYRLDCAITYRQRDATDTTSSPNERVTREMSAAEWETALDKAWTAGIPHIIFTGGEPTLREDLPELIAHAESNGQITGLNTNARRLSDARYVEKLVMAGLDHVQITLESSDAGVHDRMVRAKGAYPQTVKGLKNALASPLYVMTNTTMLRTNVETIPATLDFLAECGVPTVGLNALIYSGRGAEVGTGLPESELTPLLEVARRKTEANGQRLIWYTPTQYCHFDPMTLDLGVKGCTAALYNMCVEPDGKVLPCQSYYQSLGNLLVDDWDSIWNHPLAVRLRERQGLPEKCDGCALLSECGGGCPLQFETEPVQTRN
jgi:radical SAM protein with 4Fe4S-binding SPASM domain